MHTSDFDQSLQESILSDGSGAQKNKASRVRKRRGCFQNCWKFTTHRKIMPQQRLYEYLADQSTIISDS